MIDPVLFSHGWKQLNDRFGRNISDDIMAIYYDYLSEQMDDGTYAQAVLQCILKAQFFPSALEILHQVKEEPKAIATKEWDVIVEAAKNAKRPQISEMGQKALGNIGGRIVIDQADPIHELPHLRRQFIDAYLTLSTSEQKHGHPQLGGNHETN
jgi:hypothetical protein